MFLIIWEINIKLVQFLSWSDNQMGFPLRFLNTQLLDSNASKKLTKKQ